MLDDPELNPQGARTLLFIHGLGSYLKFWRYQLDAFAAQGYRVIVGGPRAGAAARATGVAAVRAPDVAEALAAARR